MVDSIGASGHRWQIQQELETDQWVLFRGFSSEEEMRKTFNNIKRHGHEPRVLGEWDSEQPEPEPEPEPAPKYKPGEIVMLDGPNGKPLLG